MDERHVADYFVIAGLPDDPSPLEDFSYDGTNLKSSHNLPPITDIAVIFPSFGEIAPEGFILLETTSSGFPANLNHGSFRSPSVFLCYRRGRDKPPLVDIGIYYEGTKESVLGDVEVIYKTPGDRCANVNNSGSCSYITIRRASENDPCNVLVVTDICVIFPNKGESPPHTFRRIDKDLNRGLVGSVVYLCYKKSMNRVKSVAYKPGTIARFPLGNHLNFPLPDSVPLFCLPMGATIECWPKQSSKPDPVFSTFVLTVSDAVEKVYGAAISFYERYPEEKLSVHEKMHLGLTAKLDETDQTVNVIRSLCILSHWPFFDTFESFLKYLYKMSITGPHSIPIERYISHFMQEVPFPSPQRPRILIQISASEYVVLVQPEDSPLPLSGASFTEFLKNLGPDNCLAVLLFALTEQKILLHSLRPDVLTSVAEAISMLIFPFRWQCPYIPLCPLGLSDVLNAPMPYIVGVDSRYFDLYNPPSDIYCINLDTNSIYPCDDKKRLNVKFLPKKPARTLEKTLTVLFKKLHMLTYGNSPQENFRGKVINNDDLEEYFKVKRRERLIEIEIQEAFLRFMASILKGFRNCLRPITGRPTIGSTDCNALFDINGFLKSRDKAYHRFYGLLMKTQMFTRFIEERSFVTDKDASLAFFDECTEKVDIGDGREARLIELDEAHQSERTVYVPLPDTTGLPSGVTYTYDSQTGLNSTLFHNKQRNNQLSVSSRCSPAPSSPMARRTKQEIRSAQKLAQKHSKDPQDWAKCLKTYAFCLWFIHLPAYVKETRYKCKALKMAFDVLVRMQRHHPHPFDEVCYRVLMQLCGQYGEPVLAIKLLSVMKSNGIQPNAITYGYYNKAVLESKWPSQNSKTELWNKLRYAVLVISHFRRGLKNRPLSFYSESDAASSEGGLPEEQGYTTYEQESRKVVDQDSTDGESDIGYNPIYVSNPKTTISTNYCLSTSLNAVDSQTRVACDVMPSSRVVSRIINPSAVGLTICNNGGASSIKTPQYQEVGKKVSRSLIYNNIDFTESNEFRNRVGSIVRNSECTMTNRKLNAMRGSSVVDSVAGLLIPSQTLLDDVFVKDDHEPLHHDSTSCRRHPWTSDQEDQDGAGSRVRHNSGSGAANKCSLCSSAQQNIQHDSDSGTELLRSGSYGSDVRILSHLSKNGSVDLESTVFAEDGNINLEQESEGNPACVSVDSGIPLDAQSWDTSLNEKNLTMDANPALNSPTIPFLSNSRSSSVISPQLTPVTQNDPLGVFSTSSPLSSIANSQQRTWRNSLTSVESPASVGSTRLLMKEMNPTLFRDELKRRTINMGRLEKGRVPRSSSFCVKSSLLASQEKDLCRDSTGAKDSPALTSLHRSSTVPDTAELIDVRNSKNMEGSAAITAPLYNQLHSLTSLLPTFNPAKGQTWKTVVNKLSEIKETLSSKSFPTTPIKANNASKLYDTNSRHLYDEDDHHPECASRQHSSENLSKIDGNETSVENLDGDVIGESSVRSQAKSSGSIPSFESPDQYSSGDFVGNARSSAAPSSKRVTASTALEILITSCCRCHSCQGLLYDEEIMANWSHEESDLNTRCAFCRSKVVPVLTVIVKDYRCETAEGSLLTPAQSTDSIQSSQSYCTSAFGPLSKTSSSPISHRELEPDPPLFRLDDSPENASMASTMSSPVGSPQNTQNVLHHSLSCKKAPNNDDTDRMKGAVTSAQSETNLASTTKKMHSGLVTGEISTSVSEIIGNSAMRYQRDLPNTSLPSSVASSTADMYGDGSNADDKVKGVYMPVATLDPIIIPYLSPIVLRKELESVLEDEGDHCLSQSDFVDNHPIIFWNLLWYCTRINVPTHLPGLCLRANVINRDRPIPKHWMSAHSRNVLIRCMWDNPSLYEETGQSLYLAWNTTQSSSSLVHALVTDSSAINRGIIQQIISGIQCDDVLSPLKIMIGELRKRRAGFRGRHYSIYRDLLFLCISYIGRHNICLDAFDYEYRRAFQQLSPSQRHFLQKYDYPPEEGTVFCRQSFDSLDL